MSLYLCKKKNSTKVHLHSSQYNVDLENVTFIVIFIILLEKMHRIYY